MGILQTAERSSNLDPSENVIFQRHLIAYKEAAKLVEGTTLEIGSGEGYGINELAPKCTRYIALDKFDTYISKKNKLKNNIEFIQAEVPPLKGIENNSVDYVVTFQVIEHIKDDQFFLSEIKRVLRPGGKLIMTTPNILMTLTKSPWHIREYNPRKMYEIVSQNFESVEMKGVFGNDKVMEYYEMNKKSVAKITKWDIFNMQHWMPRWFLRIPYDILNRFNRHHLQDTNTHLVSNITYNDYYIKKSEDNCLDHFVIATK